MTYPRDLDEFTMDELKQEVERRKQLLDRGICPYCERHSSEPTCKAYKQHQEAGSRFDSVIEENKKLREEIRKLKELIRKSKVDGLDLTLVK